MKKTLFFVGILFLLATKAHAYPTDVGIYRSTVIAGSNTNSAVIISSGVTVLVDYQVLSTSTLNTDGMDIFDAQLASGTAIRTYPGFPVNEFVNYPLGIELTSGTFISVRANTSTQIRVRYYRKQVY